MPKVINQTGVSIDSLQAKFTFLEYQFTKLTSEHKVVLDSLRSLDKTIKDAGVKTTFYSDQLNYQLFWISFVLLVAGWFSWTKWVLPLKEELIESIDTIKVQVASNFAESKKTEKEFRNNLNKVFANNAGSMTSFYRDNKNWAKLFFHDLTYAGLLLNIGDIDLKYCKNVLGEASQALKHSDFKFADIEHNAKQIEELINTLFSFGKKELAPFLSTILLEWNNKIEVNTKKAH